MKEEISVNEFREFINRLPSDPYVDNPRTRYHTQKEHWLGWLSDYHGPGAYGRKGGQNRDARFAYNHVVCPELLLYLVRAIPLNDEILAAAEQAARKGTTLMEKAGAIRKVVPWQLISDAVVRTDEQARDRKKSIISRLWGILKR